MLYGLVMEDKNNILLKYGDLEDVVGLWVAKWEHETSESNFSMFLIEFMTLGRKNVTDQLGCWTSYDHDWCSIEELKRWNCKWLKL